MSTLDDVVKAMSKETNNSTLGWDVVVNYTAKEMNELLAAAYKEDQPGQLVDITTQLKVLNPFEPGQRYTVDYVFKLGPPLIQFKGSAMVPACRLEIPVTGGSVKVLETGGQSSINAYRYRLVLSGISLGTVNGTKGASRDPKPSRDPFVFNSSDTTGAVTLDLVTSASKDWLKVELEGPDDDSFPLIDGQLGNLEKEILDFFRSSSDKIHWDLAQVNNNKLTSNRSTQLVPERFRFATYSPAEADSTYTILSLFIHIVGHPHRGTGDELQSHWTAKWSKNPANYGVPPIPDSNSEKYTASVIFDNTWIQDLVKDSGGTGVMEIEEVEKTKNDTWGLKWKVLTGKKFEMKEIYETEDKTLYRIYNAVSLDLDKDPHVLYMTIGQNSDAQASALLEWTISYSRDWSMTPHGGTSHSGTATVTNKVNEKKYIDNDSLPQYKLRLDASLKEDNWTSNSTSTNSFYWTVFSRDMQYSSKIKDAEPDLPTFTLVLFDFDFFMVTNLLLPNQKVIEFEKQPGARFPRDLYLVGKMVHQNKVKASRASAS
ncbi:hypothetical protein JOM56_005650 [Amanita muscaria]